jgi:hypothetical protein
LLATVFAQLALIALILIPAGLAAQYEVATPTLVSYLGVLIALVSLGLLVYRRTPSGEVSYPSYIALITACYLGMWMLLSNGVALNLKTLPSHWALGLVWLLFLTFIYDKFLRVCDERFPLTRFCGLLAWGMVLLIVVSSVAQASYKDAASSQVAEPILMFSIGALRALELVLLFMASWWVAAALMMLAWIVLSMVCANSHGHESRSTVATGRLGFIVSLGAFLLLTMALWSLLEPILEQSVGSLLYEAIWFKESGAEVLATRFLEARFTNSIESLGGIVVLLSLLVLYLLLGFTPSIVAETKAGRLQFERLGRWLTRTYRYLDRVVLGIVLLGVLFAAGVALDIFAGRFLPLTNESIHQWFNKLTFGGFGDRLSAHLSTLVQAAGGTTVALAALGGLLSRYLPWIRGPLDAALDVDNHFREFPRHGIPRARIFARYAALLNHIQEQGYERVVVVSHSQGTVITADLMHYLRARGLVLSNPSSPSPVAKGAIDPAKLWHWLSADRLKLLTMGSPLRQLYAARFPVLYRWMFSEVDERGALADRTQAAERLGPSPKSIGAKVWWNAYTTGDYIGRWLWSGLPGTRTSVSLSQIDNLGVDGDVYDRFAPVTGQEPISDVPQGSGAHTHYLDSDFALNRMSTKPISRASVLADTTNVAQLVDRLIAS